MLTGSVNNIGKLDSILNEEYRDIVAHNIPVALVSIELNRKSPNISDSVGTSARA
jgi:hypothetical protein